MQKGKAPAIEPAPPRPRRKVATYFDSRRGTYGRWVVAERVGDRVVLYEGKTENEARCAAGLRPKRQKGKDQ